MRHNIAELCLAQLARHIPEAVALALEPDASGLNTLGNLSAGLRGTGYNDQGKVFTPMQDGSDLIALAEAESARLYSPAHGKALRKTLEENFCALTANHHGADFHPEFVQGNICFALHSLAKNRGVIPVIAGAGVNMKNDGYPRGIVLGRSLEGSAQPERFPILSKKHFSTPVSLVPPFTQEEAVKILKKQIVTGSNLPLLPHEQKATEEFVRTVFADAKVLAQKSYSDQASVMNSLIWRRLFAKDIMPPPLISLNATDLCCKLLQADLRDKHSLLSLILEPAVLQNLWERLDGTRGCWSIKKQQSNLISAGHALSRGSFLFWFVNNKKHLQPMSPSTDWRSLHADGEEESSIALTPGSLQEALESRRILPGLFLLFGAQSLARGLRCCGGVYQTGYLAAMRKGTAEALRKFGEEAAAQKVEQSPDSPLNTGLLPLRCKSGLSGPSSYAASPVDITGYGGINAEILTRLQNFPAGKGMRLSLAFFYESVIPKRQHYPGWLQALDYNDGIFLN
jgi:hypothetical protein